MRRGKKARLAGLSAAIMGLLIAGQAQAETCTISASNMAFGVYDPLAAAPLDTTSTIQVTCVKDSPPKINYRIRLDTGQSGSYTPRAMTNGVSQLNYNLYLDVSRTTVWGDGTGGSSSVKMLYDLPMGASQTDTHTVYGRVFAGQTVSTGSYLDTITATVTF